MIVYLESSAVLAWLLGEIEGDAVRAILEQAERVVTSSLTRVECCRALARARILGRISATEELAALDLLELAETRWDVHDLSDRVLLRASAPFPSEPVRTLNAIHLATAALVLEGFGRVSVLTLDERIRVNTVGMGLGVVPEL